MPATSRSVVGMAHSYKKHYPATPALKESRIASKLAPTYLPRGCSGDAREL
ncbi:hypothetical protein D9M68_372940 [compost metagenome]